MYSKRIGRPAVAAVVGGLAFAAAASASPLHDYRQSPAQTCSAIGAGATAVAFVPVPGDPTGYQKCGPAGPLGIKHCRAGADFDASVGYCVVKDGEAGSGATLSADAVWQETGACTADCPPKPIKVRLNYSGSNVGAVSLMLFDPAAPGAQWGGSASALTGDGDAHSVVVTANKLTPTAADWVLKPGATVAVQAYLTDGRANPDGDPTRAVATLATTVTASGKPTTSSQ